MKFTTFQEIFEVIKIVPSWGKIKSFEFHQYFVDMYKDNLPSGAQNSTMRSNRLEILLSVQMNFKIYSKSLFKSSDITKKGME